MNDAAADTMIYRYDSGNSAGYQAEDGGDLVSNFKRGQDSLVIVDHDGSPAVDLATFLNTFATNSDISVRYDASGGMVTGLRFVFATGGFKDGTAGLADSVLIITFSEPAGRTVDFNALIGGSSNRVLSTGEIRNPGLEVTVNGHTATALEHALGSTSSFSAFEYYESVSDLGLSVTIDLP